MNKFKWIALTLLVASLLLAGLTGLTWLDVRHNQIRDLGPLAGLTELTMLHLSDNQVVGVNPLAGLTRLGRLDLSRNHIVDVTPLVALSKTILALVIRQPDRGSEAAGRPY